MYLFHIFYSFLPLRNPIGFGAADFVVFAITALLVFCTVVWPLLKPSFLKIAARTPWSMAMLAALPIILRLLLLPRYPAAYFSAAVLPAFCYWMLRGWITPGWAFFGGLLCIFKFGPLSPWMNSESSDTTSAVIGCLVLGAIPRFLKIRPRTPPRFSFAAPILVSLCVAQFLFWYGLHLWAPDSVVTAMSQYEAWTLEPRQP